MSPIKALSCSLALISLMVVAPTLLAQEYALPTAAAAPVITMDYQGNRLQRIDAAPTLTIYANGDVVLPQNYSHTQAYQGSISSFELQRLLDFIIRENQFFGFEAAQVNAKLSTLKRQPLPVHFTTTVIKVNADNQAKEVRLAELGKGPMIAETQRMLAIKQRLERLMSLVKLGGAAKVDSLLAMANQERTLKLANSNALNNNELQALSAGSFTVEDLEVGGVRSDGSVHVRFRRSNGARATIDIGAEGNKVVTLATDK